MIHKTPQVVVKAAKLLLNCQESVCVLHCGGNLQTVTNDARVSNQSLDLTCGVFRNRSRFEVIEGLTIVITFLEDCFPAESSLGSLKNKKFEKRAFVM